MNTILGIFRRHFTISVLALYAIVVAALYYPALNSSFMGDDFNFLKYLHFNVTALLNGQNWSSWIGQVSFVGAWVYFRPLLPVSIFLDYLTWGLNPVGYHLTDWILHISNSFLVFVLCLQLVGQRLAALAAGILFAVMPVHVGVVSWVAARADGLVTLCVLLSIIFFIYFDRCRRVKFFWMSLGAFAGALLSKEMAVTVPIFLALYDWLYHSEQRRSARWLLSRHLPFWILLAVYVGFRLILPVEIPGDVPTRAMQFDLFALIPVYFVELAVPFVSDVSVEVLWIGIVILCSVLLVYRLHRQIWFAVAWMTISIVPALISLEGTIFDRNVYLPSVGLSILLGDVLTSGSVSKARWMRAGALVVLSGLVLAYSVELNQRNETYVRGTVVSKLIPDQVRALHETMPDDARMYFTGIPVVVFPRGVQAFGWIVDRAIQIAYDNPRLQAVSTDKFPLLTDRLDQTYFFEYNRRKVTERSDLIRALEQRNQCAAFSIPSITWDFSKGVQDWETWNELTELTIRDGALATQSLGDDPYMASPSIAIPTLAIGEIAILMRVQSSQPTLHGDVYWLATGQDDFWPGLKKTFIVQADGQWHSYRVDIADGGQLRLGDQILRLRLDPVDAPADISIKTIQVFVHCGSMQDQLCTCS